MLHEPPRAARTDSGLGGHQLSNRERMSAIAASFPALRNAPGVRPFDQHALAAYANGPHSHGEILAARFILGVWSGDGTFPDVTPFDLFEAMGVWDSRNRAAFLAWCQSPYWP